MYTIISIIHFETSRCFYLSQLVNPCLNGGECYGNSSCFCEEVYTGSNCETCLCQEGTCDGDHCECTPGYTGNYYFTSLGRTGCYGTFTLSDTETDTATNKLAQSPMGICIIQFCTTHFYGILYRSRCWAA